MTPVIIFKFFLKKFNKKKNEKKKKIKKDVNLLIFLNFLKFLFFSFFLLVSDIVNLETGRSHKHPTPPPGGGGRKEIFFVPGGPVFLVLRGLVRGVLSQKGWRLINN
ncbi:MAG: hypothetical protein IPL59_05700 [Candidatus Competibacteraceae bacterium]|nr:hypothetical protein [Candidatus Competibacteraceae bacterium]